MTAAYGLDSRVREISAAHYGTSRDLILHTDLDTVGCMWCVEEERAIFVQTVLDNIRPDTFDHYRGGENVNDGRLLTAALDLASYDGLFEFAANPADDSIMSLLRSLRGRDADEVALGRPVEDRPIEDLILASSLGQNVCPECKAGKCPNCTRETLDLETDVMVPCVCGNLGHRGRLP